jgi:hypothetical protein
MDGILQAAGLLNVRQEDRNAGAEVRLTIQPAGEPEKV